MVQENLISKEYAEQNRLLHEQRPGYGANGGRYAEHIYAILALFHPASVIDFGCGKGKLRKHVETLVRSRHGSPHLGKFDKTLPRHLPMTPRMPKWTDYEPSLPERNYLPTTPAELLISTDVMEHVEPDKLEATIATIARLASKYIFITFALRASNKTLPDGRNTHLIVEDADFWRKQFEMSFDLLDVPWKNQDTFILFGVKL